MPARSGATTCRVPPGCAADLGRSGRDSVARASTTPVSVVLLMSVGRAWGAGPEGAGAFEVCGVVGSGFADSFLECWGAGDAGDEAGVGDGSDDAEGGPGHVESGDEDAPGHHDFAEVVGVGGVSPESGVENGSFVGGVSVEADELDVADCFEEEADGPHRGAGVGGGAERAGILGSEGDEGGEA